MAGSFQKTTSNFFVTFLIGLIVVSFMFTGYESMKGAPNAVAKVGSYPITSREYQMEYNRQIAFFQNFTGGKSLSSQDIERFGIKSATLRNLVQKKLRLIFADRADVVVSPEEVKDKIKELEYFLTNGQFDINKYKGLLRANGLSPKDFEEDITNQITDQNASAFFADFPFSNGYVNDIVRFKSQRYIGTVVEIKESIIKSQIKIGNKEIKEYLANEANKARTENLFKERKASLDVKEKVKASHILVSITPNQTEAQAKAKIDKIKKELTTKNFAKLADKYTEDPTGKGKGGDLGYFARGKMVPEFEQVAFTQKSGSISKPVKTSYGYHIIYVKDKLAAKEAVYADFEKKLATELIKETKTEELKKITMDVKNQVIAAIKANNQSKLKSLKKEYGINVQENVEFNRYDGNMGKIQVASSETKVIWEKLATQDAGVFDFDLAGKAQVIALQKNMNKDLPNIDRKKELSNLQRVFSDKVEKDVLGKIGDNTPVKQFVNL